MPKTSKKLNKIEHSWTLLTNHGRILLLISKKPTILIRELASLAGVTERRAQSIVSDLENEKYIIKIKDGRQNYYSVNKKQPFRHPAETGHNVGELIKIFFK